MAEVFLARSGDTHSVEVNEGVTTQRWSQPWTVILGADDPHPISSAEVLALRGLPRAGWSTYRPRPGLVVPFAICRTVVPKPRGNSRRVWDVVATFELTGAEQEEPQNEDSDPQNLMPRIEPFVDSTETVMLKDWDGKLIVDPFKKLWDEPVMAPVPLAGVRVTRYVASFTEQTLADWLHTTNASPWRGQPEDAWCIRSVTGREVQFGPFTIGQLQFEIVSHPLELEVQIGDSAPALHRVGWLEVRPGRSAHFKNDAGKIEINRQATVPTPVWIDKDGKKSATPYFFVYRSRRQKNFNEIV